MQSRPLAIAPEEASVLDDAAYGDVPTDFAFALAALSLGAELPRAAAPTAGAPSPEARDEAAPRTLDVEAIANRARAALASCEGARVDADDRRRTVRVQFGDACTVAELGRFEGSLDFALVAPDETDENTARDTPASGEASAARTLQVVFVSTRVNGRQLNGDIGILADDATASDGAPAVRESGGDGQAVAPLPTFELRLGRGLDTGLSIRGTAQTDGDGRGVSMSASGSFNPPGEPRPFALRDVHQVFTRCYPDRGEVAFRGDDGEEGRIEYTEETSVTGRATFVRGGRRDVRSLPPYGDCPALP